MIWCPKQTPISLIRDWERSDWVNVTSLFIHGSEAKLSNPGVGMLVVAICWPLTVDVRVRGYVQACGGVYDHS